jgi:flavodoxin
MNEPITTAQVAVHGSLALFGAVVHASKAYRDGKSKTWVDFFTLTIMSSFSGVMFALVGLYFFADQVYLSTAMAGVGGFLGVEGLTLVIDKLRILIEKR